MPRYPLQKGVLILKENSPQFIGKLHLETHGTAMNKRQQFSFAKIFMAYIETQTLSNIVFKPTVWKRYIDEFFSLCKPGIVAFFEQAILVLLQITNYIYSHWKL